MFRETRGKSAENRKGLHNPAAGASQRKKKRGHSFTCLGLTQSRLRGHKTVLLLRQTETQDPGLAMWERLPKYPATTL